MNHINILGVNVHNATQKKLFEIIFDSFNEPVYRKKVMYVNIHVLNSAYKDDELKNILNSSDIVYCDGAGVRIGAKLKGYNIPERMTGADWIHGLCPKLVEKSLSIYLLGGYPGIAQKAKDVLEVQYGGLEIKGQHHGFFDMEESKLIIEDINKKKPHILFVGFGTPLQEKWIEKNFNNLDVPVVWAVGALMDFVSGSVKRAPDLMLNNNMEWLYRLFSEPKRMWRRYAIGNLLFFLRILLFRKSE